MVTNEEHRPKSHRAHLEWTPSRMVHWAHTLGAHTARLFERIMTTSRIRKWDIAAAWASSGWPRSTRRNEKNSLDRVPPSFPPPASTPPHDNIRRLGILRVRTSMPQEPMMEKLVAMRLLGMADALKTQEQDPATRKLSFLE
jgi:hypothetical protein